MKEVWLVMGYTSNEYGNLNHFWSVAVYPEKEAAELHKKLLNNTLKQHLVYLKDDTEIEPDEIPDRLNPTDVKAALKEITKTLDPYCSIQMGGTFYYVERVDFALHPDDYKDKLGL